MMMGTFRVPVRIYSLVDATRGEDFQMLVDTGATQSIVPGKEMRELGIAVERRQTFLLANGDSIDREVGWVGVQCQGRRAITLAIFGERSDAVVLGALTLEELGFEVDPRARILKPAVAWLMAA